MLGDIKNKILDQNRGASTTAATTVKPTVPATPAAAETTLRPKPDAISTVAVGMTIVGKVECEGVLHVFGRIEGELKGSNVVIGDGALFEGNVVAQEITVDGHVKGTIHANRVKLRGTAVVQGDIFHRSLSIEENAQFEGSSRREDNPAPMTTATLAGTRPTVPSTNGGTQPTNGIDHPLEHAPGP